MNEKNKECLRPWNALPFIRSYASRYLLLGSSYTVLRKWKTHRGILFDRQILKSDIPLQTYWRNLQIDAIVPIPQTFHRQWKMRGSRTHLIARWISNQIQAPILPALHLTRSNREKRQAELNQVERLQRKIRFSISEERRDPLASFKTVLLVDDFMTTGKTLRAAAECLSRAGVQKIHVFTLGMRAPQG